MQRFVSRASIPLTAATAAALFCIHRSFTVSDAHVVLAQSNSPRTGTSAASAAAASTRLRHTAADAYFRKHNEIPKPSIMHANLPEITQPQQHDNEPATVQCKGILVIGDVHGCYDELLKLHAKAVQENDGCDFHHVIQVGDMCNKGPKSVPSIRHVRQQPRWLAVRGNHDNGALHAALVEDVSQRKKKYNWVEGLSDNDVAWLSELPYTIRIPAHVLGETVDTIIVHAGLVPGVDLEQQSVDTMVTIRDVEKIGDSTYAYFKGGEGEIRHGWAGVWDGPENIIFGHDAKRQLQQHAWTLGLDTGACYGKKLTGIILPERKLVQVDSMAVYCPIK